ncbi:MAG: hypothetical protein ACI8W7_005062 [Gammaproteobacteria bacterium]|jgi:hypothetical protein
MDALKVLLPELGARMLWRSHVRGQITGVQAVDEVLAIWYPSHQAFIDMPQASGASRNYDLRERAVEYAVIHRCDGTLAPLT